MIGIHNYPEAVDVAIVGSGPTGSAYARILCELVPHATIAMFEVGPTVSEPPGGHVRNIIDAARRTVAQRRSEGPATGPVEVNGTNQDEIGQRAERRARPGTFLLRDGFRFEGEDGLPLAAMSSNVGGMAAHWTAACPRPGGKERIEFLPDLDDLLDEAERLLGVRVDAFDTVPFGDVVRTRLSAALSAGRPTWASAQRMPLAVHRREDGCLVWSGADVVMGDVTRNNPRFSLFDESLVTRVITESNRASALEVRHLASGSTTVVRTRFVVAAADALRTPQLLWNSGVRPAALGHYLNDQPQVVFATQLREGSLPAKHAERHQRGIGEYSGVSWVPFTDERPFHGQVMQLDASPISLEHDVSAPPGSIVGLGLFCAKDLRREDCLEFAHDESDAYGMPAIRVHYRLTERDHQSINRAREEIVRLGEAVGRPVGERPFTMPPGASLHYQGTTRMGRERNDETVCDPNCEVWGVSGLYVAGNGVIPTATACNPTLTSVALAVRGARHIAAALVTGRARLTTTENTKTGRSH